MIMQCRMVSWTIFIIVAQQRQENNHCEPDAHFVVVKVIMYFSRMKRLPLAKYMSVQVLNLF